jgi:hypothetical protein
MSQESPVIEMFYDLDGLLLVPSEAVSQFMSDVIGSSTATNTALQDSIFAQFLCTVQEQHGTWFHLLLQFPPVPGL